MKLLQPYRRVPFGNSVDHTGVLTTLSVKDNHRIILF
jgi:hypothetical protein